SAKRHADVVPHSLAMHAKHGRIARLLVQRRQDSLIDRADCDAIGCHDFIAGLDAGFFGWTTRRDAFDENRIAILLEDHSNHRAAALDDRDAIALLLIGHAEDSLDM